MTFGRNSLLAVALLFAMPIAGRAADVLALPPDTSSRIDAIRLRGARRPELTHEQFSQYWKDRHAPLLMSLDSFTSGVRRYIQQHSVNNVSGGLPIAPYDGVAEVWFDDLSSVLTTFAHEDYASIVAKDEEKFLDRTKTAIFLSSETQVV